MKVVISDFPDVLGRDLAYEKSILEAGLKDCQVVIYPYKDKHEFMAIMKDAEALLTAFLPIDKEVLDHCDKLKCIGYNSTGYDSTDYDEATRRNIAIIPIEEYCTQEVAEHTLALILALSRGLKHYTNDIDSTHRWQYYSGNKLRRLEGQKLGLFGFGKIGRAVAKRAQGFGIKVLAYDKYGDIQAAKALNVKLVEPAEIFETCDIISNHMNSNADNLRYFDEAAFDKMVKQPIFINVSRGATVDEGALIKAIDEEKLAGVGLDVLEQEKPDLHNCSLLNRENVIITPHAAFYSEDSIKALQTISCENVVHYLNGEYDKVKKVVNAVKPFRD